MVSLEWGLWSAFFVLKQSLIFIANDDDSADSDSHDEEEEDDEIEPNGIIIDNSDPRGDYDNPMPMLTNNDWTEVTSTMGSSIPDPSKKTHHF